MIDNVLDFKILINLNVNMLFFTYVGIHIIIELLSMPSDQIKIPILSRLLIRPFNSEVQHPG